jgi:non-ribosomal peptide synthetase component F
MLKAVNDRLIRQMAEVGSITSPQASRLVALNCRAKQVHAVLTMAEHRGISIEKAFGIVTRSVEPRATKVPPRSKRATPARSNQSLHAPASRTTAPQPKAPAVKPVNRQPTTMRTETTAQRLARFRQAQAKLKASGFVGHLGRVATNIAQ